MTDAARTATPHGTYPLIVHSHLRWDFVWQRPQQILSRFGRTHPVLFVEEPVFADDIAAGSLDVSTVGARVHRVVPRLPARLRSSYDDAATAVRAMLHHLISARGDFAGQFQRAVQWFYTPMPAPIMIGAFGERGVVYDCMDELAQFRFAPPELAQREQFLMSRADVVFTGGRELYESKSRRHDNVHFFGCGVDADHFARALDRETPVALELRDLPHPVLGYFGVVDERLDYGLIDRLAEAFPEGSVVFVGPTAKVDPAELPQRSNLHWLGQRSYDELPEYVKGFDVCLMPFALNEATQYINPTKTLEYMAAGKPIVSTAVPDVVRNFTPIVRVARTPEQFVEAARGATTPEPERIEAGLSRARSATWESTVASMDRLIYVAVKSARHSAAEPRVVALPRRALVAEVSGRADTHGDDEAIVA
jgi:glycosyltransferase involved in cell wall biosynthesis